MTLPSGVECAGHERGAPRRHLRIGTPRRAGGPASACV